MKQRGRTKITATIFVLSLVLVLGSFAAAYASTEDTMNCPARWGELIGSACITAVPATSLSEGSYVMVDSSDDAALTQCRTRWGEPVGAGCRVPAKVIALVNETPSTVQASDRSSTNCRTRWGEPIGIGCRVPAGN